MANIHKLGRNDPCHCGSGLKYKKCCLANEGRAGSGFTPMPAAGYPHTSSGIPSREQSEQHTSQFVVDGPKSNVSDALNAAMAEETFHSVEQAQAFADNFMKQQNSKSLPEFHGLSPEQMHHVLNAPFNSSTFATFNEDIRVGNDIPYVQFFEALLVNIGNGHFKPTATGNLPRNFCRSVALAYWGEEQYAHETRFGNINSETDFHDLHIFRLNCEMVGYLRKYRGRYIIGKECRALLKHGGLSTVYRGLFKLFVEEFNWAYGDRYETLHMIQHSWLFSLYLLQQHGDDWKPSGFYEDAIINAFPQLLNEVEESDYTTPELTVRRCYRWRVLQHWMVWFGLADVENLEGNSPLSENFRIRKRPITDSIVTFHGIGA